MTYQPHDAARAAASAKADQAVKIIGAAAPLIALALAGHPHQDTVVFTYTNHSVVARPLAPSLRDINKAMLGYLDKAFTEAGWAVTPEESFTGEVRVYAPSWASRP